MPNIDEWFELTVPFEGRAVPAVLRMAHFADIAPFTHEPLGLSEHSRTAGPSLAVLVNIATFDGRALRLADVDRIVAEPQAHAAILAKRNQLYERGRNAGVLWAQCPHCRDGEVKLSLLSYATRFGALPPHITAADPAFVLPPSLSLERALGQRPAGAACAARIRFELPTSVIGMRRENQPSHGVLRTIDPKREEAAWNRWAPEDSEQPDDKLWWRRQNPCFRAAVALSVALRELDHGRPTPALVSELAVFDVYFLDALYFLTHFVNIAQHAVADECPSCGKRFFPVL